MKSIFFAIASIFIVSNLSAQSFKEKIEIVHDFDKSSNPVLILLNISGDIQLNEHNENRIAGHVNRSLKSESNGNLASAKNDFILKTKSIGDTLIIYTQTPCSQELHKNKEGRWAYKWINNCKEKNSIQYNFDFEISVPEGTELYLSTVNNGDITVLQSSGNLRVENINGGIAMNKISGQSTYAHTINGDVDIQYDRNPVQSSRYYTLNGDINVLFKPEVHATVKFKSFNGDFFTDVEDVETFFDTNLIQTKKQSGISYKINDGQKIRIGNGSKEFILDFETFNGNAYFKTQS